MRIASYLVVLLCSTLCMSFRTITRAPLLVARVPVRMMSDHEIKTSHVAYGLFKGKGAINVKPIPATLKIANGVRTVDREGALLFEFAPAVSTREYDWSKKISFALDPTECAELVRFKETETVSFMHNPNLGGATPDTTVMKKFSLAPVTDGKGMYAQMSVTDKSKTPAVTNLSVMLTWAELEVIRSIARYCIPRFIGIDLVV